MEVSPFMQRSSVRREIGIGLHFENLAGVPGAMSGGAQYPFVAVPRTKNRMVDYVSSQIGRGTEHGFGLRAAVQKMFQRHSRSPAAGGFGLRRGFHLGRPVRDVGH